MKLDEDDLHNPTLTRYRWRATHQSRIGPICQTCQTPLATHFIPLQLVNRRTVRVWVRNGQTSRGCFEVLVR